MLGDAAPQAAIKMAKDNLVGKGVYEKHDICHQEHRADSDSISARHCQGNYTPIVNSVIKEETWV